MTTPTTNQYLKTSRRGRGMPAYVSGQSPIRKPDMTNLGLWLDADSITPQADGTTFQTWSDKSGNARDAAQATAGNRPFYQSNARNGRAGVWFDGGRSMTITMTTPAWGATVGTAYIALYLPIMAQKTPFGWSTRTDEFWYYAANTSYIGMMRSARLEGASIGFTAGTHVVTVLSGASAYNVYDNGATLYSGSSSWAGEATGYVGTNPAASVLWLGYIYEILIYAAEHTADQLASTWNYLRWKWQIG